MQPPALDDFLDQLVGDYSDRVARGKAPVHEHYLTRVPAQARPGLERCLKMIDAGMAQAPSAAQPLGPGTRLGKYRLLREVGRGGMALVWLATDSELERPVALKLLRPGLALEQRHVDRFRREALAIAKLRHPHIVQVFDVGEASGFHYLAMEYVEGPSLATVLEALPEKHGWTADDLALATGNFEIGGPGRTFEMAVAGLLAPVADALHAAHQHGLVHRDVKPSNILLRSNGNPVVADFGLAKGESDPALSITGDTLGTPYYMSPEQAWMSETKVDHRTDVYSLGVTLYEALSGERPFEGGTVLEVFEKIKTCMPSSLRSRESRASKNAGAVTAKAMAREPRDRYGTALELHDDLIALSESRTTKARQSLGGALQRAWTQLRFFSSGQPFEYKSQTTLLGWPLIHIVSGRRYPGQPTRVAKGWFAIGDVAIGAVASGGMALGGLVAGGMCAGILSWGGISLGLLLSAGGISMAPLSFGGISVGFVAFGGLALGYAAIGGFARGVWSAGGNVGGKHMITDDLTKAEEEQMWKDMWTDVVGRITDLFS